MIRTKRIILIAAVLALLMVMPVILQSGGLAFAESTTRQFRTAPEGYNEHDYNKLIAFLEITDENGIKNGEKLSAGYNPDDPETWGDAFEWTETDDGLRIIEIHADFCLSLEGSLDLDGCNELSSLFCYWNRISELKVTNCPNLKFLSCGNNRFTTLDVSQNENLYYLDFATEEGHGAGIVQTVLLPQTDNRVTELDVSGLTGLKHFECALNPLEHLDISENELLETLSCTDCCLSELIADNPELIELNCETNRLQTLVLRNMDSLETLECFDNELEAVDLSECPVLTNLSCCYNRLTELDTSHNPMLERLFCWGNNINAIDLSNNPNMHQLGTTNISWQLYNTDNPLTQADLSGSNMTFIDMVRTEGGGTFGINCIDDCPDLYARQNLGWLFDGWYNEENELVSMRRHYVVHYEDGTVFTAKFIPDGVHVFYGDVDENGQITISDAILALRCSMGIEELDDIQQILADLNGDGEIAVSDAVAILRTAMGI